MVACNGTVRTPPEEFTYDQNELVSLIKRFYELLVEMAHFETEHIRWPPEPLGWSDSELNVDSLRLLGRNETVIDLLRHIPYPRESGTEIHSWATAISYLREHWRPEEHDKPGWHQKDLCMLGLAPYDGFTPPNFICLTQDGSTVGTWWAIDTEQGCIYPQGGSYMLYGDAPPEADEKWWLNAKAVTFAEFFNKLTDDLTSLKLVPLPAAGNFSVGVANHLGEDAQVMRNLYREYGWPEAFRREEFRQAAAPARLAALYKQYPRSDSEMDPEELEALEIEFSEHRHQ
ncbi:hypothetical protein CORC01_09810 [Colletotrichum orchidophilum]|uniref:Uncharacterized protein n=1 Tax=Colletotrichum orchidophilum TaxID=1209926 RepID=A0A1G4B0I7_9PEZI|nr:uncharacterized protein CORC01_09810 [Colletotrichum orchidophilum]OHE94891.1 hypothetical protein CORC01_09810 [Colletotrichum orchidophilum]